MSEKAERKTLPVKFKCDVCEKPDGKPNIQDVLMRCKSCGVCVHQTCYGKKVTEKADPDWLCWACEAVRDGREEKRPTECSLCSVEHGIHAMHPLFDKAGPQGKQKILRATEARGGKPERKAWVHTLCAYYVNSYKNTLGCVFGQFPEKFTLTNSYEVYILYYCAYIFSIFVPTFISRMRYTW